ncbi:hypothetical protein [Marinomonas spartinae]|uniref:hypothetical protein n=1 Tax=Marinomonas spartinae TaxID=1792290 RepID=UPI0018F1959A|nr:hypothetical protein [Marinomonas spartinae]MBJ7556867.1 hypothetical protein [Marinomonas spartinae]
MDRSDKLAKEELKKSIENNSQTLYILSVDQLIELYNKLSLDDVINVTKNVSGYVPTVMDIKTVTKIARDIGALGRIYEKNIKGKQYVIFKGHAGLRSIFTGTKYLDSNAKVVDMVIGKAALRNSIRSGARLTIFLTVPLIILQHILKDEVLLTDLVADLAVSMVKVGISSIVAAIAGTAIGSLTTVAAAPLVAAIFVGIAVGYTLNSIDERFFITDKLSQVLSEIEDNTIGELSRGMWELEKKLRWQIINRISPGKGIFYP